jgi:AcrR family transcriptional regulator
VSARRESTNLPTSERQVRDASKARRDSERDALKATIIAAAGELFLEKGFDAFSMRQVAARIGYSATTIYHHFLNKEDLLRAVLDSAFATFEKEMRSAVDAEVDPARKMGALGKAYVRFGVAHPVHYQLMFQRFLTSGEEDCSICSSRSESYGLLHQGVLLGIEQGWLPGADPRALTDWMWATVHGLVMLGITEFRGDPARLEAAMTLFDMPTPETRTAAWRNANEPKTKPTIAGSLP